MSEQKSIAGGVHHGLGLFALAVALVCAVRFAIFYLRYRYVPDLPLSDDTLEYLEPAVSFLEHGRFINADGSPWLWRPPGYPLVIAALFELFGANNLVSVIALQNIAFFVCVCVVAAFAHRLAGAFAAIVAAILILTDFSTFYYTNTVLSESLFGLMLCLGVFFVVRAFDGPEISHRHLVLAGLAITAAAYMRIPAMYLIPTLSIVIAAFAHRRMRSWRSIAGLVAAFAMPWILIGGAWYVRNFIVADHFFFTSEQGQLFLQRCLHLIAALENVSKAEAYGFLVKYVGETPTAGTYLGFILDHFALFVRQSIRDLVITLVSPGQWNVQFYVPDFAGERQALTPYVLTGDVAGLWREMADRGAGQILILSALVAHTAILYVGVAFAAAGIVRAWRLTDERQRMLLCVMALLIAYFLGQLVFWEGSVRFRFPITPFLTVLAGYGYALQGRRWRTARPSIS